MDPKTVKKIERKYTTSFTGSNKFTYSTKKAELFNRKTFNFNATESYLLQYAVDFTDVLICLQVYKEIQVPVRLCPVNYGL